MIGPIPWMGGKSRLAKRIITRFPDHHCYCEPFAGGAQVFWAKEPGKLEVLNDLDGDLLNFYRVVQRAPARMARLVASMPHSRALWSYLQKTPPDKRHSIAQAAAFWYLQKAGFGGKRTGRTFGTTRTRRMGWHPKRIEQQLLACAERLCQVTLECLPWQKVLAKYDSQETLFYLDPPYWKLPLYQHNFGDTDHVALAEALREIKGSFILSYNDVPIIRDLYSWATLEDMRVVYATRKDRTRPGAELLITP